MLLVVEVFDHAKQALNTQQPDELVCRDKEIAHIRGFLDTHVNKRKPGSLYISGAPGTGKTAVIKHLLEQETLVSPEFSSNFSTYRPQYVFCLLGDVAK